MDTILKSTSLGAVICGVLSTNAIASDFSNYNETSLIEVPAQKLQIVESTIAGNFYQGDFQQLSRALERSMDFSLMYTGGNANLTPSVRAIHV